MDNFFDSTSDPVNGCIIQINNHNNINIKILTETQLQNLNQSQTHYLRTFRRGWAIIEAGSAGHLKRKSDFRH